MADELTLSTSPDIRWAPAYTKPRCEKVVQDYCQRHGVPCYLPLMRRAKRYQRRTVETYLPMFKGYVFAQIGPESKELFLRSHKVVHVLPVTELQEQILVAELNSLRFMEDLQKQAELVVLPDLTPGVQIVVTDGPLKGFTGIVERRKSQTRITVNVEMLGQSVHAEMDVGEIDIDAG